MITKIIYRTSKRGVPHSLVFFDDGKNPVSVQWFGRSKTYRVFSWQPENKKLFDVDCSVKGNEFDLEKCLNEYLVENKITLSSK